MGQNFGLKEKFITQIFFEFFAIKFDGNVWSLIVALWDGHVKFARCGFLFFVVWIFVADAWWSLIKGRKKIQRAILHVCIYLP